MTHLLPASAILLFAASLSGAATANDVPPLGSISIKNVAHSGNGCRPGSVASNISPDNKALTFMFDDFIVELNGRGTSRKTCRLNIELEAPLGWSYAIFNVNFRGYASLDQNTTAVQTTGYSVQNAARNIAKINFTGPIDEDYQTEMAIPVSTAPYSECLNPKVTIDAGIEVTARPSALGNGLMTVDSIDGELTHQYSLVWKRCAPPRGEVISISEITQNSIRGTAFDGKSYEVKSFGGACYRVVQSNNPTVPITPCEHSFSFFLNKKFFAATTGASGKIYNLKGELASPAGRNFHSIACEEAGSSTFNCTNKLGASTSTYSIKYVAGQSQNPPSSPSPNPAPLPFPGVGSETISTTDIAGYKILGIAANANHYEVRSFGGNCHKVVLNGTPITPCEHGFRFLLGKRFIAATRGTSGKLYNLRGTQVTSGTFHNITCNPTSTVAFTCASKVGARVTNHTITYTP